MYDCRNECDKQTLSNVDVDGTLNMCDDMMMLWIVSQIVADGLSLKQFWLLILHFARLSLTHTHLILKPVRRFKYDTELYDRTCYRILPAQEITKLALGNVIKIEMYNHCQMNNELIANIAFYSQFVFTFLRDGN